MDASLLGGDAEGGGAAMASAVPGTAGAHEPQGAYDPSHADNAQAEAVLASEAVVWAESVRPATISTPSSPCSGWIVLAGLLQTALFVVVILMIVDAHTEQEQESYGGAAGGIVLAMLIETCCCPSARFLRNMLLDGSAYQHGDTRPQLSIFSHCAAFSHQGAVLQQAPPLSPIDNVMYTTPLCLSSVADPVLLPFPSFSQVENVRKAPPSVHWHIQCYHYHTVHYTETRTDSEGKKHTEHKTRKLHDIAWDLGCIFAELQR